MIVPFSQTDVEMQETRRIRPLPVLATILGVLFAILFTQLLPNFRGFAALAIWPLGIATGMFGVTLGASLIKHQMHWDLLLAGKMLALAGTVLFFISSL
ncbi:MAG: hypothetical protein DWQ04_32570 [Chloroflexi bacterium]|nr:MAG: hypothetical protein DWQ04_32570 [Chloroflexota bacterium]